MRGHDIIIKLRRMGLTPDNVFVHDFQGWIPKNGTIVELGKAETPELIDWRFLVDLTAIVEGPDDKRLDRIAKAAGKYARRVFTSQVIESPDGKFDVVRITDSQTGFLWHK